MSLKITGEHKKAALAVSVLLFVLAAGYTAFTCMPRTVRVTMYRKEYEGQSPTIKTLRGVSMRSSLKDSLAAQGLLEGEDYDSDTDLEAPVGNTTEVTLKKKVDGTISYMGKSVRYSSSADTVGELLSSEGIETAFGDDITPARSSELTDETSKVSVVRVKTTRETREEKIPYDTKQTRDESIPEGQTAVQVAGIDGRKLVTEDIIYQDGKVTGRKVIEETVVVDPVEQVERVGTGKRETPEIGSVAGSGSSSGSSGGYQPTVVMSNGGLVRGQREIGAGSSYQTTETGESWELSDEDFDLVCAIVHHESGGSYEAALAVMSCVMNRVDADGYGSDPVAVLTAPGQFASYLDGYYEDYTGGRYSAGTEEAVRDCLAGTRSHGYYNFRSYETDGSVNIGGNWFF